VKFRWILPFALTMALGIGTLSSCATPSQKYVVDKKDGVYLTVPFSWHLISNESINAREATSKNTGAADRLANVTFQQAFSPNAKYAAKDVLTLVAPIAPLVYVRVRNLLPDEINAASYNSLRNIIVPLTSWIDGSDATAPPFELLSDSEVVQKNARGVRTSYSFTEKKQPSQTIDQTTLISDDRSKIYVLIIRCTTICYNKSQKLLSKIANSFTVRGTR
jgi:hypothetical protein